MGRHLFAILCFLTWVALHQSVMAQTGARGVATSADLAADEIDTEEDVEDIDDVFKRLRRERERYLVEIPKKSEEIKKLRSELTNFQFEHEEIQQRIGRIDSESLDEEKRHFELRKSQLETRIANRKRLLDRLESADPREMSDIELDIARTEDELEATIARLDSVERRRKTREDERQQLEERLPNISQAIDSLEGKIIRRNLEVRRLEDLLFEVEFRINELLTPQTAKNRFKLLITVAFAVLVGLVIFGFFVVAMRDERVRRAIFSGESGIQFITLFSLVIAIILFGITGILEGRALAALLGGISGYILGRGTAGMTSGNGGGGNLGSSTPGGAARVA